MLSLQQAKEKLFKVSNLQTVRSKAKRLYGLRATIEVAQDGKHKYIFKIPSLHITRRFGDIHYEDFTKHKDPVRRQHYLERATKIPGSWKQDKYSKNNLSIHLLW
jgi:glutathionyl-hydroquinone reductase